MSMLEASEFQDNLVTFQRRINLNAKKDPFILKFPPEISSQIFFLSLEAASYEEPKKLPTSFVLGSVCHGWRLLAWSTPELWSTLSFSLEKPRKPEGLSQLQGVTGWLQLSGDLPLTLRVLRYCGPDSISPEGCAPVIDVVNQHSGRWHKLFLRLPAAFLPRFCGTSPPSNLCDLSVIRGDDVDNVTPAFRMLSRPSPTHFTIWCYPVSAFDIAWDNLTFLKLTLTIFDGCMEVIQKAPLLEFCWIEIYEGPNEFPPFPKKTGHVRHRCLRTLTLSRLSFEALRDILDMLELPSLETYCCHSPSGDFAVDNVISLLNRSGIQLKQLTLGLHDAVMEDIKKLLPAVPCLQRFYFDYCPWPDELTFGMHGLFDALSSSPPSPVERLLPDLQSLTIIYRRLSHWGCVILLDWRHYGLSTRDIEYEIKIDDDTLRKISRLVNEGVHIRICAGWNGEDFLQKSKGKPCAVNPSEGSEVVQQRELGTADEDQEGVSVVDHDEEKEGCLFSFSSLISCIFCRR
ncbi:hypothetical protein M413DRAFT_23058 [Hebeloma cylindrosporum]|uniref:Uncharacterized protein n=1 Tax=Hebeloma cylindrosporum TaxID=76867 RepID=A0A0C2Z0K4_HEBCY|nr:hypothetical protein M413DRAFT_23058 [Hebeloma cylindrosporum h7]